MEGLGKLGATVQLSYSHVHNTSWKEVIHGYVLCNAMCEVNE